MGPYQKPYFLPAPKKLVFKREEQIDISDFSIKADKKCEKILDIYKTKLGLSQSSKKKTFLLSINNKLHNERYVFHSSPKEIVCEAGSVRGLFYCLQTLLQMKDGSKISFVDIEDMPSLNIRGIHLNFDNLRQMGYREASIMIQTLAKFKINTILIEYGDRFPYKRHPLIVSSNTLTISEIKNLYKLAKENFIEVIPLLQSFGHLDYLLDVKKYSYLNEGDNKGGRQICPSHPDSLKIFIEMAEEIISLSKGIRYFHIGGDETRYLGVCPKCRKRAEVIGKGGLYIEHINKVCGWIKKKGLRPIIWDDMICTFPETIDKLDKDAVIMYWDYWATAQKTTFLLAREYETNRGVVYHKKWQNEWNKELSEIERENIMRFGRFLDLEKEWEPEYREKFLPYLGNEFPKYIKSFPYLKFYRDKGFEVLGAPLIEHLFACMPDYHNWILHLERPTRNIFEFTRRCIEEGALGIIGTSWMNYPPEVLYPGILATAKFSWEGIKDEK